MSESEYEREQEEAAAAEAAGIGGKVNYDPSVDEDDGEGVDPAQRPLIEGGEGVSEGFELAEHDLEEHASHGDQHSAGRVLEDAYLFDEEDDSRANSGGEADEERSQDDR
jgi:hypothetical protein